MKALISAILFLTISNAMAFETIVSPVDQETSQKLGAVLKREGVKQPDGGYLYTLGASDDAIVYMMCSPRANIWACQAVCSSTFIHSEPECRVYRDEGIARLLK